MEYNGNGNTVLLTVIGVATLLVALVGATFAYFTATVDGNDTQQVSVQAKAPGQLQYGNSDDVLQIVNATPGKSDTRSFTIVNSDSSNVHSYDLSLVIETNSFKGSEANGVKTDGGLGQLVLTFAAESALTEGSTATKHVPDILETEYDATGKLVASGAQPIIVQLVDDVKISPKSEETHTYTATVNFVDTGVDQSVNKTAAFSGHFTVTDDRTVATPATPAA